MAFESVKDYCEKVKLDLQLKINWVQEANAHYTTLLSDFISFKDSIGRTTQQCLHQQQTKLDGYDEIIKANSYNITRFEATIQEMQERLKQVTSHTNQSMQSVQQQNLKLVAFDDLKLNKQDYLQFKETFLDEHRQNSKNIANQHDQILTLENYTERYIPIVIMNLVNDLIVPVLSDEECRLFNKSYERMHVRLGK